MNKPNQPPNLEPQEPPAPGETLPADETAMTDPPPLRGWDPRPNTLENMREMELASAASSPNPEWSRANTNRKYDAAIQERDFGPPLTRAQLEGLKSLFRGELVNTSRPLSSVVEKYVSGGLPQDIADKIRGKVEAKNQHDQKS